MAGSSGLRNPSVRTGEWYSSLVILAVGATLLLAAPRITDVLLAKTRAVGWQTPRNSVALAAADQIQSLFPRRISGTIVMAVEAVHQTPSVLSPEVEAFSHNVSLQVSQDGRVAQYKPVVLGYYLDALHEAPDSVFPKAEFLSADRRMTYLLIQPTEIPENHEFNSANDFLQEFCASPPPGYELHITGMPAIATGSGCSSSRHAVMNPTDMSFRCLFLAEVFSLPLALLIMGYLIRYRRLLILPLLTVAVTFTLSGLMLIPVMSYIEVPVDAIAAMGSVILALALDYSLFLLSRFGENKLEKFTLQQNVDIIKECTCWTVAVSGSLVAIAFFAGVLLPEKNLQGTVVCLGVAVLACVLTNVVLLPAVFLIFGDVLVGASFLPAMLGDAELTGAVEDGDSDATSKIDLEVDSKFWLGMMRVVERAPLLSIALVLLLLWPILSAASSLHITADRFAMMPLESPAVLALRRIQDRFPMGILAPFEVLVTAPEQPEVLGKFYTPVAAFCARWIMGKFYMPLEWSALIILTLSSAAFGYLQAYPVGETAPPVPLAAMAVVLGSAAVSALASLVTEKILKGDRDPFHMQKVRLDFGSVLSSVLLIPVIGLMATRPQDVPWAARPESYASCPAESVCWDLGAGTCSNDGCNCECTSGIFAGWNTWLLFLAVFVNTTQGWLVGKVTHAFSVVHRAIADSFSLLAIYFIGDPLFNGKSLENSCLNLVAMIVPLSTATFSVATSEMQRAFEAHRKIVSGAYSKSGRLRVTSADFDSDDESVMLGSAVHNLSMSVAGNTP